MPARKTKTPLQKENQLKQIADLHFEGWNQYDIADKVGVHQSLVCRELKRLAERLKQETLNTQLENRDMKLAEIRRLKAMYYELWRDSGKPLTKTKTEKSRNKQGKQIVTKSITEKITRDKDMSLLDKIHWCIIQEIKLLYLDRVDLDDFLADEDPTVLINFDINKI